MGTGCKNLVRVHTEGTDVAVGTREDGRIGTFRDTRTGEYEWEIAMKKYAQIFKIAQTIA